MVTTQQAVGLALVPVGLASVGYALLSDAFLGGKPGVGFQQWAACIGGAAMIMAGLYAMPWSKPHVLRWTSNDPRISTSQSVQMAVWLGVLIGLVEVGHHAVRKFAFGTLFTQPLHVIWMAPLSFVLIFGALAIALRTLHVFVPIANMRFLVFWIALFGIWSQVIFHNSIDGGAGILMAAGFAAYIARICGADSARTHRIRRRTLPWLLAAVAIGGISVPVWETTRERQAVEALPAPPEKAPNVLFIVLDTVRADHLGPYGYHRDTTPRLSKLAESSYVFEWPIAPSSWTLPSHSTFFTGRYQFDHNADWLQPLDETYPTLAEILSQRGYATAGFVGNLAFCLREHGIARGFQRYEDFYVDKSTTTFSTALGTYLHLKGEFRSRICSPCKGLRNWAPRVTDRFLGWLDETADDDRPFFAFLNYFDAHHRYEPPPPYDKMFTTDGKITKWQGWIDKYDGLIAYIDEHVGKIEDDLRRRGLLDNTWIIVTGDHGELFGEHRLEGHANSLYRPVLHCALIVRPPGGAQGRRFSDIVSLRDLPATILDVTGQADGSPIPGYSLAPFWSGANPPANITRSPALAEVRKGINLGKHLPVSRGDMRSLTADGFHYILNGDGIEELYKLEGDPMTEEDLIETPEGKVKAAELRERANKIVGGG